MCGLLGGFPETDKGARLVKALRCKCVGRPGSTETLGLPGFPANADQVRRTVGLLLLQTTANLAKTIVSLSCASRLSTWGLHPSLLQIRWFFGISAREAR
jgi:hypothetical protein